MADQSERRGFTPRPWIVADSNSYRRIVRADRCEPVCCPVTQRDGHPDLQFPNGGYQGPDARLMIAAPDLYEALRKVSFAAQTTGGTAGPDKRLQEAIHDAEAALAKAEGRTDPTT